MTAVFWCAYLAPSCSDYSTALLFTLDAQAYGAYQVRDGLKSIIIK